MLAEDIPILSLDSPADMDEVSTSSSPAADHDLEANGQIGIVLVHGFGGGVFSWRHVMGVLARQVGCTVAAFDRPGWGLTSKPRQKDWEVNQLPNPYKLENQVLSTSVCLEQFYLGTKEDFRMLTLKGYPGWHVSITLLEFIW